MTDVLSAAQRSRNMAAIRSRDTKPEIRVRRALHAIGYRFRLRSDLPGHPDLVLPTHRCVVFVHGCFWHLHSCRFGRVVPATRPNFWARKRADTARRDKRAAADLRRLGWRVLTVWECHTRSAARLQAEINRLNRHICASAPKNRKVAAPRKKERLGPKPARTQRPVNRGTAGKARPR